MPFLANAFALSCSLCPRLFPWPPSSTLARGYCLCPGLLPLLASCWLSPSLVGRLTCLSLSLSGCWPYPGLLLLPCAIAFALPIVFTLAIAFARLLPLPCAFALGYCFLADLSPLPWALVLAQGHCFCLTRLHLSWSVAFARGHCF